MGRRPKSAGSWSRNTPSRPGPSARVPYDGAGKGDRLAVLLLQGEQAGPVAPSIVVGEVADLEALHPHRHRVGVVRIVGFGHQHGVHVHAHAVLKRAATPNYPPEAFLVAGLAHDFEVLPALAQLDLHAVTHPGGPLLHVEGRSAVGRLFAASEQPS
jgi:hypothetical protein